MQQRRRESPSTRHHTTPQQQRGMSPHLHASRAQQPSAPHAQSSSSRSSPWLQAGTSFPSANTTPSSMRAISGTLPSQDAHFGRTATPLSTSRSSIAVLEDTIADVMGVRMQSLAELRQRIEQLSDLYRHEEQSFQTQMQHVLQQSEAARLTNETREEHLERSLERERAEKAKLMELMAQFKKEGAAVIAVMKESLKEANGKWKSELERNAQLSAQLRRATTAIEQGGEAQAGYSRSRSGSMESSSAAAAKVSALEHQVATLKALLTEEDAIVVELQQRNRHLEKKVQLMQRSTVLLLDDQDSGLLLGKGGAEATTATSSAEGFHTEVEKLQSEIRRTAAAPASSSLEEDRSRLQARCAALEKFTKLLVHRLQAEQRQRLKIEEQSARMAGAQDQLAHTLESRVKELEAALAGNGVGPMVHGAGGGALNGSNALTGRVATPRRRYHNNSNNTPRDTSSPLSSAVKAPLPTSAVAASSVSSRTESHHQGRRPDDDEFAPLPRAQGPTTLQQQQHPYAEWEEDDSQPLLPSSSKQQQHQFPSQRYSRSSSAEIVAYLNEPAAHTSAAEPTEAQEDAPPTTIDPSSSSSFAAPPQQQPQQRQRQQQQPPHVEESSSSLGVMTLEEQLAALASEFDHSVEEWSRTLDRGLTVKNGM